MRSFETILVSLSLSLLAFAAHGVNHAHRHADLALRPRFSGIRMTWYDITTGTTACGGNYQPSDYVVAISQINYNGGSLCGKQIAITYQGKTADATIVDECQACPDEGLDLTQDLFSYLAGGTGAGVISGDWNFAGAAPAVAPKPKPTTTYTPPPAPETHYNPPTTTPTTTYTPPPPPSSTSSKATSSSAPPTSSQDSSPKTSSSSSAAVNKNAASSVAQPSATPTPDGQTDTINSLFQVMNGFGGIVLASHP